MPNFNAAEVKRHATLEWWRRLGLDVFLDPDDDSMKWQPIIVGVLLQIAALAIFIVLVLDVIPNGANEAWLQFGPRMSLSTSSCEYENAARMVHQMSTALSAVGYILVGIIILILTYLDFMLRTLRKRDKIPYTKGPNGNVHIKVTAIQNGENEGKKFISVDPEYLSGNTPCLLRREPVWGLLFALQFVFLGIASFLFHASNTELAFVLENTAWFSVTFSLATYTAARALADGTSPLINLCSICTVVTMDCRIQCDAKKRMLTGNLATWCGVIFTVAFTILAALFIDYFDEMSVVTYYSCVTAAASICLLLHYWGRNREVNTWFELGMLGFLTFALGLVFLYYDLNPVLCSNAGQGYFQAHAVWQSMSAAALGLVYFTLRSDVWMYDVVDSVEERRAEDLEDAYRVPLFQQNVNRLSEYSNGAGSSQRRISVSNPRPRTFDSQFASSSMDGGSRPRTYERPLRPNTLESAFSDNSTSRLEMLRVQQNAPEIRASRRNLPQQQQQTPVAYWTCPDCAFEDNEMSFTSCERCGENRPPLEDFIPIEYGN